MHKTDAANNVANEFSDGTPPLTPGTPAVCGQAESGRTQCGVVETQIKNEVDDAQD